MFTVGQTVRLNPELTRDWFAGRAAVGGAEDPGIGRIVDVHIDGGFCGDCEYHDRECPGPWYGVLMPGVLGQDAGIFGEHELAPA